MILAAVHGGLGRDAETGTARPDELPGENSVWELAERFPQLAAIVYGHSHQREPGRRIGRVLVVQPKHLAMEVARVDLMLERDPRSGRFRLANATSSLLTVTHETKPDPQVLEIAARYFRSWPEASCDAGPLVDRAIPGYNYDTAQGVEYEIDLARPVGSRVRNLRYRGAPLRDDEPLRIALNCHRAAGSAGYSMFRRGEARLPQRAGHPRPARRVVGRARAHARATRRQLAPAAPRGVTL